MKCQRPAWQARCLPAREGCTRMCAMVRRKLERVMFKHEPLQDEVVEQLLACRTDDALRIDLAHALESLPAHYLEVVLLRDFEELTIAEIAVRLGEQPGAIKSRLHRARELVREYLVSAND